MFDSGVQIGLLQMLYRAALTSIHSFFGKSDVYTRSVSAGWRGARDPESARVSAPSTPLRAD